jgi:hypothetical protein
MRRILYVCIVLATVVLAPPAFSQTQNDSWQLVRNLPLGKTIDVYTKEKHQRCKFLSADDQQINCRHGKNDSYTLSRSEITKVRLPYTGIFTIGGFFVGTGAGVGIGVAAASPDKLGEAAAGILGAMVGAVTGTVCGLVVDKSRQETLYLAP